jgi:hypothetical protein
MTKQIHWATLASVTNDGGRFSMSKFNARPIPGDIIEVHPDGFWRVEALKQGLHGWDRTARNLIRVPRLNFDIVKNLAQPSYDSDIAASKILKRKYSNYINNWETLPWKKNKVIINGREFEECYLDINSLTDITIIKKVIF